MAGFALNFSFSFPNGTDVVQVLSDMPNVNTADYLIASIQRRGMIPTNQDTFPADSLLAIADEELRTSVVQLLLAVREEYLIAKGPYDQTLSADVQQYPMHPRAIAGRLRQVLVSNGTQFYPLPRTSFQEESEYSITTSGMPCAYAFDGNYVRPLPPGAGTLRQYFFIRPSRLVSVASTGTISAIDRTTGSVTCSNVPTTFTLNETYDFVKGTAGFECLSIDQNISSVVTGANGTIIFGVDYIPDDLNVGDFVCLAGESPIPQIPVELHPWLAQLVVVRVTESLGDLPKVQAAQATADRLRNDIRSLLSDRDQGSSRVVVNKSAPGMGRNRGGRW